MRILVITTCYKPFNCASTIDIEKKINLLSEIAEEIEVITVFEKKSLKEEKEKNKIITRVKNKLFTQSVSKSSQLIGTKESNFKLLLLKYLKSKVMDLFLIPDINVCWINPAYTEAKKKIEGKKYDYIVTMSQMNSAHIVGLKLKKKYPNLKWITYWNDPWFANLKPYHYIRQFIENKLERNVIKNSDYFILFCDEFREKLLTKFKIQENRIFNIDGFYEKFKPYKKIENEKINILHTGDIYLPIRNLGPFIEALEILEKSNKEVLKKLEFIFVGKIRDKIISEKLNKIKNVKILGTKSYEECNQLMENSNILLLLGNRGVRRIPSKIFDYISLAKPIITILGEKNEPLTRVFNTQKRGPILENNCNEIKFILEEVVEKFEEWNNDYTKEIKVYEKENIKTELEKWLLNIKNGVKL
ncbi:MAG: hypothetical protein ACRC54_01900 [Fusobacteriaceae bacterium]